MSTEWNNVFRDCMRGFEIKHPHDANAIPVSIKVRVTSGCFHREHSPHAYEIIDDYLSRIPADERDFTFEEHESGPEILVYLAVTSVGLTLAKSVVDLITAIVKARSESAKKGDHPQAPVELIVRRFDKAGEIREEKVLHFNYSDPVNPDEIERKLTESTKKLLSDNSKPRKKKK